MKVISIKLLRGCWLAGKRKLSIEMIRRLSTTLGIPAEILLGLGEAQPSVAYQTPATG